MAGISIGAINAALIADNPPEKRVDRLRKFWGLVTADPGGGWPDGIGSTMMRGNLARGAFSQLATANVLMNGAPGGRGKILARMATAPGGRRGDGRSGLAARLGSAAV